MRLRRLAPLLALALVAAPAAHADADPASDVLYTQRIYLPFFGTKVSSEQAKALKSVVDAAWAKGYQIKVALIPGPNDLGGVYQLYGKPQAYARFLGQELVFLYKGPLVIVMPQGFGVFHYKKPVSHEQALLQPIKIGDGADGLADAATVAVAKLSGVKAPAVSSSSADSGSGTPAWAFVVIAVGGVALLAVMFLFGPKVVRRKPA